VKELRGFIQKAPIGHFAGHFVKEPKGFASNVPTGHLIRHFLKEIRGFAPNRSKFTHWVNGWVFFKRTQHLPTGYLSGKLVGTF
jgi:hypothetical protein